MNNDEIRQYCDKMQKYTEYLRTSNNKSDTIQYLIKIGILQQNGKYLAKEYE